MKEKIKQFVAEKRAVSPVIGVVLMVAVVVILAAVIGAFVLGLGGSQSTAPQAAFTYSNGVLTMSSGDTLDSANVEVVVTAAGGGTTTANFPTGDITAGSSVTLGGAGGAPAAGSTIAVVWNNPSGDDTATLFEITV